MRNGSGDEYLILFNKYGAILKGFAHESKFGRYVAEYNKLIPGILERIPEEFKTAITEPAFSFENSTFCIWRKYSDRDWNCGITDVLKYKDYDGSSELLFILDGKPETYKTWAETYYEKNINLDCIKHIYQHKKLNRAIVSELNSSLSLEDLTDEISTIGYFNSQTQT